MLAIIASILLQISMHKTNPNPVTQVLVSFKDAVHLPNFTAYDVYINPAGDC